jgi:hypothetical protein
MLPAMSEHDMWSAYHFTLTAGDADAQGLLRAVADRLDTIGPVQVADIMFRLVPHEDGIRSISEVTVYYERPDAA